MSLETVIYGDFAVLDLAKMVLILAIGVSIAKAMTLIIQRSLRGRIGKAHLKNIVKVTYYTIIFIAVISVLPLLGIKSSNLLVAGGIGGIILGFASQSVVSNLISGVLLMFERPIKLGDTVNIEGTSGTVEDIRIISTTLRTFEGIYVRIPNDRIFTTSITNYVANVARRFEYIVGIRYSDDADQAIGIIKDILEDESLVLKNPSPEVFVDTLGDNAVNIIVRIWAPATEWYTVKKKLLWVIKKTLEEHGIEIAFPQRTVWFANELRKKGVGDDEIVP
jgi:small-conductance mechanosensitive channel